MFKLFSLISKNRLKAKIERARTRLQTLWDAKGYTDAEVLAAGNELDKLINEYQKRSVKSL